jgi:retron-type reverse transcriptase
MDGNTFLPTERGTPQGGVISLLLMNIALYDMEEAIADEKCRWCELFFKVGNILEVDHLNHNHAHNELSNLVLLHRHCHDECHATFSEPIKVQKLADAGINHK